jgi:spoIIIJ-associated protein
MAIFEKLFGSRKKEVKEGPINLLDEVLDGLVNISGLDLAYEISKSPTDGEFNIEFTGADEEMLTGKEGQLLDAFQLYLKRVVQHQIPDEKININVDCAGFRQQANDELIELANKLREIALAKGKSVYFRALSPKDRKTIHQYLADDGRVKSRSVGEGHFKKIKIYPVREMEGGQSEQL